ncbi:MAG: hypothetical protein CL623_05960 [Arcobacter sp.]|nr:hypothetical protein [Arcobacter sp.]|tara:strand:+ start:7136 stop:7414 length:279 start_codon:yes stop_codon:yes gene_type:complete
MNTKELEKIIDGTSKKSTAGKVWTITKLLSSATWITGKFIAKNTPTVLGAAWEIKKEINEVIVDEYQSYKKEQKELEMDERIKMLTHKGEGR